MGEMKGKFSAHSLILMVLLMAGTLALQGCSSGKKPQTKAPARASTQPASTQETEREPASVQTMESPQGEREASMEGGSMEDPGEMPPTGRFGRGFDRKPPGEKEPVPVGMIDGENFIIVKAVTTIRRSPSPGASPMGMVYGNDRLQVIEEKDGWVRVRYGRSQEGWIPLEE